MTKGLDGDTITGEVLGKTPSAEASGVFFVDISRYKLLDKLGSGGMATVFRAEDSITKQKVALKVIENTEDDPSRRTRFEREVRAAGGLVHPNICRVLAFGQGGGKLFMAMELVEGVTLQKVVRMRGSLPVPVALEVLRQLLGALECAAAKGVVHRDLKPANVMITQEGAVKLLDFGIAKSQEDATVTATGMLIGTPAFMSPEQILGGVVDGRSDLFSVGVTFLVMLTGRVRFHGLEPATVMVRATTEPVPSLLEECPIASSQVDRFLGRMCMHNIDARFQSATEALAAIKDLVDLPGVAEGPELLRSYVENPDPVAARLAAKGADRERVRADKLLKKGPPAEPAAALALYRASLLDPTEDTRRRLNALCAKANLTFDPVDDPRITEAQQAFELTPWAPGVLKRLSDLYRARGHVLLAAAFLHRYLRTKPLDTHAQQQLNVLLEGPEAATGSNERLRTSDIVAGIKTGGHVDPALARAHQKDSMGPLTAAGLRAKVVQSSAQSAGASQQLQMPPVSNPEMVIARPLEGRLKGAISQDATRAPLQFEAPIDRSGGARLNVHPLVMMVGAVVLAGILLAFFSKFIKSTVDDVQMTMGDNEDRLGRIERNNVERLRKGYIDEARAQLERGSPAAAIRQVNLLLATEPPAEQALEGIWLRARGRMQLRDLRAARADLEEYLAQSTLKDPRREDVKKLLDDIHAQVSGTP